MNGRTTYGELTRDMTHALAVAHARLLMTSFASQASAQRAIDAHRDAAAALGSLGWRLVLGPQRHTMLPHWDALPEQLQPSARLCDVLTSVGKPKPWPERQPTLVEPLTEAWGRTALAARTAHDLLATYWDAGGRRMNPTSEWLERSDELGAAVHRLADQVALLAEDADVLAVKATEVGLAPEQARLLEDGGRAVRRAVGELQLASRGREPATDALEQLQVARPTVRAGDPVEELGDRVARLHRFAWQLTQERHVGVATLTNHAAAGCLLNKAAGTALTESISQADSPVNTRWAELQSSRLHRAARAWYTIYRQLGSLHSLTPGVPGVRHDVERLREILNQTASTTETRLTLPTLLRTSDMFVDVAQWNVFSLVAMSETSQLLLRGKDIPAELTSDDRHLAEARLLDRAVMTPASVVEDAVGSYNALRGHYHDAAPARTKNVSRQQPTPVPRRPSLWPPPAGRGALRPR